MSNFSVRWRLCPGLETFLSRRLAGPRITDEFTANRLCPDAIARLCSPLFRQRTPPGSTILPALSCFRCPTKLLCLPFIRALFYPLAAFINRLLRRSRDNSLVKRPGDASLSYLSYLSASSAGNCVPTRLFLRGRSLRGMLASETRRLENLESFFSRAQ